jgi:uncharacterized protein
MNRIIAFVVGLVFGTGLYVSGMSEPNKVLGFLDLAGEWDPSLAFVMAGAIAVGVVGFRIAARRGRTLFAEPLHLPSVQSVDAPLVVGSILFGLGWGLAGICPGPALVDLGFLDPRIALFVVAMLVGMLAKDVGAKLKPAPQPADQR